MNHEQQVVFDAIVGGSSVVMTGAGGVGKTFVLSNVIDWAKKKGKAVGVTATTGTAALLLNGVTLHSFLAIGLGTKPAPDLAKDLFKKGEIGRKIYEKLCKLDMLIIDEISMLNDQLFDLVSQYLSIIRKDCSPFGGVQLILSGDLYQIPPISGKFFFDSNTWKDASDMFVIMDLTTSQRHCGDITFMKALRKLRVGQCNEEITELLKATENNSFSDGIQPSILYTKNVDVDVLNKFELDKLVDAGAMEHVFMLKHSPTPLAKLWATSSKVPEITRLCIGAQVMLKWNVDLERGLCNGARGIVTGFAPNDTGVRVKFKNAPETVIEHIKLEHPDDTSTWIKFMPLRLAWAITINVAQGATLDAVVMDMDGTHSNPEFLYGKFYTAVSRVRDLNSIQIKNLAPNKFIAHPDVRAFYISQRRGVDNNNQSLCEELDKSFKFNNCNK